MIKHIAPMVVALILSLAALAVFQAFNPSVQYKVVILDNIASLPL